MALTRKKITVRGKNGKTFQRSVMVRAGEAVKRTAGKVAKFVGKHKGKIAGAAALAGAAYLGVKHGSQIAGAAKGLHQGLKNLHGLHQAAKASGMSVEKGTARHMIGSAVGAGRAKGREADSARMGNARDAAGRAAVRVAGAADHATRHAQQAVRGYKAGRELGATRGQSLRLARAVHSESRQTR